MQRTNTPKQTKKKSKKSKPGPKSSCTPEVCEEAYRLCLLGLTNRQLANWFGKDITTVEYWYKTRPRFRQAVNKGRKHADGKVVEALYKTALGYEHPAVKFFKIPVERTYVDENGNEVTERTQKIKKVPYTKKYKPDTKAALKFLGVRNRETWGRADRVEHKHAHMHIGDRNIHQLMDEMSKFSTQELEVIAKLGIQRKAKQLTNGDH